MKDPRNIQVLIEAATYEAPTYRVIDGALVDGEPIAIHFCKGNKEDASAFRQEGVFVESLLEVCLTHLQSVNQSHLASRETSLAITKIEEALFWQGKRAEDRKRRGVQGTYQK